MVPFSLFACSDRTLGNVITAIGWARWYLRFCTLLIVASARGYARPIGCRRLFCMCCSRSYFDPQEGKMEGSLSLLRATWDRADSYRPI